MEFTVFIFLLSLASINFTHGKLSSGPVNFKDPTLNFNNPQVTQTSSTSSYIQKKNFPSLPNVMNLIPQLPNKVGNISIPKISNLPPLSSYKNTPGLSEAIGSARSRMETLLGITNNFVDGIQSALQQAFESNDPTGAVRTLVNTILDAYLYVASMNPMFIIGYRVLQEGIKLVTEIANAVSNITML